jgi:APA family basic amino acid/polyamine antiporter
VTRQKNSAGETPAPQGLKQGLRYQVVGEELAEQELTMGSVPPVGPVQKGRLLCILGLGFGVAVTVGGTIAMGILRTPGDVAAQLPDARLYLAVWGLGSLYALLGAISVAELGAMRPRSGGPYVLVRHALGPYPGFVVGWSDWLNWSGSCAAEAMVIGEYTGDLVPQLRGAKTPIALAVLLALALLQWRGVRWGSRTQEWTSAVKAFAFLALVVGCFVLGTPASSAPAAPPVPTGWGLAAALVLAMQLVMFTYGGWEIPSYFGEEVQNPGYTIPRSMIGSVLAVSGIYLLVNVALLYVLPISEMANNDLAAGAAAEKVVGPQGAAVVRGLALISLLAGLNAAILLTPRILFALSRDGLFLAEAATANPGGTPAVALLLSVAASAVFLLTGTFEAVLAVLAFLTVTNYGMLFVSVFVSRGREPGAERPYRAWGYPWTTGAALLGSVVFLAGAVIADTINSIHALLLLAASCPLYLLIARVKKALPSEAERVIGQEEFERLATPFGGRARQERRPSTEVREPPTRIQEPPVSPPGLEGPE